MTMHYSDKEADTKSFCRKRGSSYEVKWTDAHALSGCTVYPWQGVVDDVTHEQGFLSPLWTDPYPFCYISVLQ